jgi:hypothetical protein
VDDDGLKVMPRSQFDENFNRDTLIIGRSARECMTERAFEVPGCTNEALTSDDPSVVQ